jgi:hypothetical protein
MIMASDPYRAPEMVPDVPIRDLPKTEPQPDPVREQPTGRIAALWVPIAIALAFAAGLAYFHYNHPTAAPNVHADTSAVTRQQPSPN